MAIMALHGLVVQRIIGPCWLAVVSMHMDIASMVLAVRAGCGAPIGGPTPHAQVIAFA